LTLNSHAKNLSGGRKASIMTNWKAEVVSQVSLEPESVCCGIDASSGSFVGS